MKYLFFLYLSLIIISCHTTNPKSILVDNLRAEGNISHDSIYDGQINFYDTISNKLVIEANYKKGIMDGQETIFFENGSVARKDSYSDGKLDGEVFIYDKYGRILKKDTYYHGIRVGGNIEYSNEKPKYYWFCSLEYKNIFHLDYDSIKGRKIQELGINNLLYFSHEYSVFGKADSLEKKTSYFLYTFNPPRFNLNYSLVLIDTSYNVLSVLKKFDNMKPWTEFDFDKNLEKKNQMQAVRLDIEDSINNIGASSFAILSRHAERTL